MFDFIAIVIQPNIHSRLECEGTVVWCVECAVCCGEGLGGALKCMLPCSGVVTTVCGVRVVGWWGVGGARGRAHAHVAS